MNLLEHCLACYPQEAVGYLVNDQFFPLANISSNPTEQFLISEYDSFMLAGLTEYKLIHSHTMESFIDDPRTPSLEDMQGRANTDMPWGIVHCDGQAITDTLWFGDPRTSVVLGKPYIANVDDCFTLARDYFYSTSGTDIGLHPRPADWQSWNPHYIEHNFAKIGFTEVQEGVISAGDVLLFSIGSRKINHIGICLDEETFIHHLYQRASSSDNIEKWKRQITKVIRRTDGR